MLRPHRALTRSGLLVNGRREVQVGGELVREIQSADRIDLLCAFVRFAGLRLLRDPLRDFVARGKPLRVITSVYTGSTEQRALDELVELGASVKVSYETAQTRLHAKAWVFHRESGFSTAYVGSSNLTHSALIDGLEWNVRLAHADNPDLLERIASAFEQYWNEPEFVPYTPQRDGERLGRALAAERSSQGTEDGLAALASLHLDLAPKPHQSQMLDQLAAERDRGHHRNLVVAATGTGKTWVSAFDYRRIREEGGRARLLFVAHRGEILRQSRAVFQLVLADGSFGELFVGGDHPETGHHVFASVQSLARHADRLPPDAFDVVIIDEFHHAAAPTYDRLLRRLAPRVLVGLTATPERTDGQSILGWFDGRIACEVRLWQALEDGLLCPFHYFGVPDGTDLGAVAFKRGRYDGAALENVYTADDFRIVKILQAVKKTVADPGTMRALGFCVGVRHAELMARRFSERGLPSVAVHGDTPDDARRDAIQRLRRGEIRVVFAVDLFNEGVDIPEVDTLLLLRPTESATVFLQQLGRGLRWARNKSVLTVLDFIGQAHREFRFDARYRALVGGTTSQVERAVVDDFPHLPPGCAIQLERDAKAAVLANLRAALRSARSRLLDDLRAVGPDAGLRTFLDQADRAPEELYARASPTHTFTGLRREAGFERAPASPLEESFGKAFARLLHVDDDERLDTWRAWLRRDAAPREAPLEGREGRLQLMLFAALGNRRTKVSERERVFSELWATPTMKRELLDLLDVLVDRTRARPVALDPGGPIPLSTHARYGLFEILAAHGEVGKGGAILPLQAGVHFCAAHATDLFFVTLEKSEADYSPTTRYADYPLSRTRFHWESQNTTAARSETGQRYVAHERRGSRVVLFVRERPKDGRGETLPYQCLGDARYVSHEGERPMRITWELARPMPAELYQEAKVAAG